MRPDWANLSDEAIAERANLGLLKRAKRELEQGLGPELTQAEGAVSARFPDGILTEFPAAGGFGGGTCTCGAAMCRHRIMVVLVLREAGDPAPVEILQPGTVTDAELEAAFPAVLLAQARREWDSGMTVEVLRTQPPAVRLPTATVRFLARNPALAACDCVSREGCPHRIQAVWAFRLADAQDPSSPSVLVSSIQVQGAEDGALWQDTSDLLADLLWRGLAHAGAGPAMRLATLMRRFDQSGARWPSVLLERLDEALGAYLERSAAYDMEDVLADVVSLEMRRRALQGQGELPATFILGSGEPAETALDLIRVVSLGGQVRPRGDQMEVSLALADAKAGTVFLLRKAFPADALGSLEQQSLAPGIKVGTLARGQLLAHAVYRRANLELRLGRKRGAPPSLTPQNGDWGMLPAPLQVTSVAELESAWCTRPPRGLRPPSLTEDIHVWPVAQVLALGYDAGDQMLRGWAEHPDGTRFSLSMQHQPQAPRALAAVAKALAGSVRYVAGHVTRSGDTFDVRMSAVAADTLVVPLVAGLEETHPLPAMGIGSEPAPLAALWTWLAHLAHHGLDHSRREDRAEGLHLAETLGAVPTAARTRDLIDHLEHTALGSPDPQRIRQGIDLYLDLALRVAVGLETVVNLAGA